MLKSTERKIRRMEMLLGEKLSSELYSGEKENGRIKSFL
jgi:hypothetical protein